MAGVVATRHNTIRVGGLDGASAQDFIGGVGICSCRHHHPLIYLRNVDLNAVIDGIKEIGSSPSRRAVKQLYPTWREVLFWLLRFAKLLSHHCLTE
jgi:hypothetical protein